MEDVLICIINQRMIRQGFWKYYSRQACLVIIDNKYSLLGPESKILLDDITSTVKLYGGILIGKDSKNLCTSKVKHCSKVLNVFLFLTGLTCVVILINLFMCRRFVRKSSSSKREEISLQA